MIAIVTPYGPGETTLAALRLADLVEACGVPVVLVAPDRAAGPVDCRWDGRVRAPHRALSPVAARADALVTFGACPFLVARLARLARGRRFRRVLVLPWHAVQGDGPDVAGYDLVVCPAQAGYESLRRRIGPRSSRPFRFRWCRFDAAPARPPDPDARGPSLCVATGPADAGRGGWLVPALATLLDRAPGLRMTVVRRGAWAARDRRRLAALEARHAGRLTLARQTTFDALAAAFAAHAWALFPAVRAEFALLPALAAERGAGVLAFDVPPFSAVVTPARGRLIPCRVRAGPFHAPTAVPEPALVIGSALRVLEGRPHLAEPRPPADPGPDFAAFWCRHLGLPAPAGT